MGENHVFEILQAAGLKAGSGCLQGRLSQTLSQLGGGWVSWVPREADAQGQTAFGR